VERNNITPLLKEKHMIEPRLLLSLISMAIGFFLGIGAIFLIARQKIISDEKGHIIHVEIPKLGKFKTNYPSAFVLFAGALLTFFPLYQWPQAIDKIPVSGIVTLDGQASEGVMIAIIPGSQKTLTHTDGSYTLDIFPGERSYTGVAYYRDGHSKSVYLGGVDFTQNAWKFNADLRR
jgi:hypothetical protein